MASLILGPLLRYVGRTQATIWIETDGPCTVTAPGRSTPTFEVEGHHYALVVLDDLPEGEVIEYKVELDGERVWPPADDEHPPSVIRTREGEHQARLVFGSCRVGAPQREPYTLPPDEDDEGFGVDALWAYSRRLRAGIEPWPDGLLLIGDQVYADEVSPGTLEFIRGRRDVSQPPGEEVADFEEYTRLYREAWTDPDIRWLLSTVPSVMVFDDHDVIDDWNISWEWVEDARSQWWWDGRITGAFMSYWIYQHLGNLAPPELDEEELYPRAAAGEDIGEALRAAARQADRDSASARWACFRDFGRSRVLVVDSRAARVLADGRRDMVDDGEWEWIRVHSRGDFDHLVIVSSMPVFLSSGVHYLEAWSEAVCSGAWGGPTARMGEKLRRALDLEHWPAFQRSFERMMQLLARRRIGRRGPSAAGVGHAGRRRRPQRVRHGDLPGPVRRPAQPRPPARLLALSQPARPCRAARRRGHQDAVRHGRAAGAGTAGRCAQAVRALALPRGSDVPQLDRDPRAGRPPCGGGDIPGGGRRGCRLAAAAARPRAG